MTERKYKADDYKSDFRPTWCPGCGNFAQWRAIRAALAELEIPPENVVLASGIGCSSHMPNFLNVYGMQTVHGRGIPVATGVRLANPKLTVLVYGGDGDIYGIGGNHFLHACRRNVDIITIVSNNFIYGLTTGQASPTSPVGTLTKTTPRGSIENPLNPVSLAISAGATFVARGFSGDAKHLQYIFKEAIQHRGFAFVDVFSPCITFNKNQTFDFFRARVYKIEETEHDKEDFHAAIDLANQRFVRDHLPIGIFYQIENKTTYEERDFALNQGYIPAHEELGLSDEQIEIITKEFY
ncbi:MAG: 2-oxoacid:ferredoxin oxidoreductase subunit beta [Candidatus Heimdallarchaeaceae archaeon]|nr:MAG: 2-oxoacid ferredoxin oxidoreductase [Candidatus Pacearchaeota archaeon]